jgi:hypothetical protein
VAHIAFFERSGLAATNNIPSIGGRPQEAITGNTAQPGGTGVRGGGLVGVHGFGLKRHGDTELAIGVLGEGEDIGVKGEGSTGVSGKGTTGYGVRGMSDDRVGVIGISSSSVGVHGIGGGNSAADYGLASANGSGPGVLGESKNGYGGRFVGDMAQLMLTPKEAVGKPTTGEHTKGEIYMDSEATLFVCTADGTPGSWSRFTTTPVT